jgi:hypothetical protein
MRWPRRAHEDQPSSRVIRPGEPPEWVTVVHRDGSMSEVKIDGDNGELGVRIIKPDSVPLHLSGGW